MKASDIDAMWARRPTSPTVEIKAGLINPPAWCDQTLSREERIAAVKCALGHESVLRFACPCCGTEAFTQCDWLDRYGNLIGVTSCPCGVDFLQSHPNADWYANFYASGTYRKLVSAYHGRDVMATIRQEQEEYAKRLWPHISRRIFPYSILDVGSSTGIVSRYWYDYDLGKTKVTLVDPAANEPIKSNWATLIPESFESARIRGKFDCVLLCQTIDHLLEPRACLEKIRGLLAPDGLFFVDILDTEQEVAEKGWQQTLKIDHPFYFTDKSARLLLAATGFEIVDSWDSAKNHIGYLCKGRA